MVAFWMFLLGIHFYIANEVNFPYTKKKIKFYTFLFVYSIFMCFLQQTLMKGKIQQTEEI